MPPKQLTMGEPSRMEKLGDWAKLQVRDTELRASNLILLKALGLFGGAIFVMKNYGESFAA